jgi:hypothetical protein
MKQQGNILFLILIAVALFAALSYAITGSSRSGGDTISKDKAKIAAAEIVQYGTQLEQAVTRLKVINGCSDTQLSFERVPFDGSDTAYLNPNAPLNFKCHVFHPAGGGVSYRDLSPTDWRGDGQLFTIHNMVRGVGCNDASNNECYELLFLSELPEEICLEVNRKLGLLNSDGTLPDDVGSLVTTYYQGQSTISPIGNEVFDAAGEQKLYAKYSGCVDLTVPAHLGPKYYHVLMAR